METSLKNLAKSQIKCLHATITCNTISHMVGTSVGLVHGDQLVQRSTAGVTSLPLNSAVV